MSSLKVKILVVEDNLQDFIIIREVLGQIRGFFIQVDHADCLAKALNMIQESQEGKEYDIVFLDLFLPDSFGQDTFKLVQDSIEVAPPIVVLSGLSDRNIAVDIVKQGAQDYLVKGEFDANLLEKSIVYSIERKKYQDILRASEKKYRTTFESVGVAIGEYDYSFMHQYVLEQKNLGATHPRKRPIVNGGNIMDFRSMLKLKALNPEALRLYECKDVQEFSENVGLLYTEQTPNYFNNLLIAIWDGKDHMQHEVDFFTRNGTRLKTLKRVRFLPTDFSYARLLVSTVNITALKNKEEEVKQQSKMLSAIADSSAMLLAEESHSIGVQQVIEHIGPALESNRLSYLQLTNHGDGYTYEQVNTWSKEKEEKGKHGFIELESEPDLLAMLMSGEVWVYAEGKNGHKPAFICKESKAAIIAPVLKNGELEAVVLITRFAEDSEFRAFEVNGLKTVVRNFESALERSSAQKRLKVLNDNLEEMVVERTSKMRDAINDLESFSYSISHDLRAPLRAINNFSDVLVEDYSEQLDDEAKRYLGIVQKGAKQMSKLIDALLNFSRTGTKTLNFTNIDSKELVTDIFEELKMQAPNRSIELKMGDLPICQGDAQLVRQVFVNFLWNAIKFTSKREKALIQVHGKKENDMIFFEIKDNGVGFNMEYAEKLFGVFQRLHPQEDFQGTGVGLAIVQRIVSRHGGKVNAFGEENKGAAFTFSLPAVGTKVKPAPAQLGVI
jgi:signal transduction histidine kinase/DNA-binding response OmpR family regulator